MQWHVGSMHRTVSIYILISLATLISSTHLNKIQATENDCSQNLWRHLHRSDATKGIQNASLPQRCSNRLPINFAPLVSWICVSAFNLTNALFRLKSLARIQCFNSHFMSLGRVLFTIRLFSSNFFRASRTIFKGFRDLRLWLSLTQDERYRWLHYIYWAKIYRTAPRIGTMTETMRTSRSGCGKGSTVRIGHAEQRW